MITSRWQEIAQSMGFVANFANESMAPTIIQLVKGNHAPIMVGFNGDNNGIGLSQAKEAFKSSSSNGTSLCAYVELTVKEIKSLERQLRANYQKAVFVIAPTGDDDYNNISNALRPMKDLPVKLIIRLSTKNESAVRDWNKINDDLLLNMNILVDVCGEAEEISNYNSWLTYAEPLHLLRLFGVSIKEFDLLKIRKLSCNEMYKMCTMMYVYFFLSLFRLSNIFLVCLD